ncbi:fibronectin type III-like domain-contianing protein [Actinomadura nitritigenes]|uniref:fibronectin type III-like domain-contianing protein n=1 Tax=Actinomadura nitritigenes TaxID=134602 RepID=UPI0036B4C913
MTKTIADVQIPLTDRAFEIWDEVTRAWARIPGRYNVEIGHSIADIRLAVPLQLPEQD